MIERFEKEYPDCADQSGADSARPVTSSAVANSSPFFCVPRTTGPKFFNPFQSSDATESEPVEAPLPSPPASRLTSLIDTEFSGPSLTWATSTSSAPSVATSNGSEREAAMVALEGKEGSAAMQSPDSLGAQPGFSGPRPMSSSSRRQSASSLAARAQANEEGRIHKLGARIKREGKYSLTLVQPHWNTYLGPPLSTLLSH